MEIIIPRARRREALAALEKAFPGHPWHELEAGPITVEGHNAFERLSQALAPRIDKGALLKRLKSLVEILEKDAAWIEAYHPRAPAGQSTGGQFVAAGAGGAVNSSSTVAGLKAMHAAVSSSGGKKQAVIKVETNSGKNLYFKGPDAKTAYSHFFFNGPLSDTIKAVHFGSSHAPQPGKKFMGSPVLGFVANAKLDKVKDWPEPEHLSLEDEAPPEKIEPDTVAKVHISLEDAAAAMDNAVANAINSKNLSGADKPVAAIKTVPKNDSPPVYVFGHTGEEALVKAITDGLPASDLKEVHVGLAYPSKSKMTTVDFENHGTLSPDVLRNWWSSAGLNNAFSSGPDKSESAPKAPSGQMGPKPPGDAPPPTPEAKYSDLVSAQAGLQQLHTKAGPKAVPVVKLVYPNKFTYLTSYNAENTMALAKNLVTATPSKLVTAHIGLVPNGLPEFSQATLAKNFVDYGQIENAAVAFKGKAAEPSNSAAEEPPITASQVEIAAKNNWPDPKVTYKTYDFMSDIIDHDFKKNPNDLYGVLITLKNGNTGYWPSANITDALKIAGGITAGPGKDEPYADDIKSVQVGLVNYNPQPSYQANPPPQWWDSLSNFVPYAGLTQEGINNWFEEAPAKEVPAKEVPAKEVPAKEAPAKEPGENPKSLRPLSHIKLDRPVSEWTPSEEYSLQAYKGIEYKSINKFLAGTLPEEGYFDYAKVLKDAKKYVSDIDNLLSTSHLKHDVTLLRGAKIKHLPEGYAVGNSYINPAYASASLSKDIADSFKSGLLFKLTVPKGTRALPGVSGEHEIILPRNGKFTITDISRKEGYAPIVSATFEDTNDLSIPYPTGDKSGKKKL